MIIFVTGTDTEVGKTIATAALAVQAATRGSVMVVKPAQTGVGPDDPGDLADVWRLTGISSLYEGVRLRDPLAPTTAARREGVPLPPVESQAKVIDDFARTHDTVLVEGAGGLLVGLDADGNNLGDLAARLTLPFTFVVVIRSCLGTLNHTGLTVEALRARGLPIEGLVVGSWPAEPELADECNLAELSTVTGVPVIGRIPAGAGQLERGAFTEAVDGWLL